MTTKISKEMDIEARPVGDDDRNEQIHVTSLVDEALKRVEIDRQSITSIVPLSPGHSLNLSSSINQGHHRCRVRPEGNRVQSGRELPKVAESIWAVLLQSCQCRGVVC